MNLSPLALAFPYSDRFANATFLLYSQNLLIAEDD